MERKAVTTTREVPAVQVPSGYRVLLPAGAWLVVQQSLGGQFTCMTESGGLVRVDGKDADARAPASVGTFDEEKVWEALRQVYDPEIPASIVELGLVYAIAAEPAEDGHRVAVTMTLTAPGCGIGPILVEDVRRAVLSVPAVVDVQVELVFDPPWDPSRMSEAAKLQLGFM